MITKGIFKTNNAPRKVYDTARKDVIEYIESHHDCSGNLLYLCLPIYDEFLGSFIPPDTKVTIGVAGLNSVEVSADVLTDLTLRDILNHFDSGHDKEINVTIDLFLEEN